MSAQNEMIRTIRKAALSLLVATAFSSAAIAAPAKDANAPRFDAGVISGLGARNIGSAAMSGRIAAVAAVPAKDGKTLLVIGAASGGVWKSTDSGTTFKSVFDKQTAQSIGSVAIDPSNHDTMWIGTGEAWTRNSVSIGDGIYKSTDGGDTWTNMGLKDSERIAKILIDPRDGNTVYACAPGKLWSDSADRGLYKTTDGGKSWTLVLKGKNLSTGCSSISLDPKDSNTIFAALWDFRRKGWTFRSGGESAAMPSGSGLFRSADGGRSWTEVTDSANKGFPKKPFGRIAVAVAPSASNIVYAFVESTDSALFRSDDGGKTWDKRDKSQLMVWRPFYFANLIVDPKNPDRLFKPDLNLIQSLDGGKSFANVGGGTHGDHHDVWIDPTDTQHVISGDDGGLWQSYDGGNKWWKQNNLPVSQFYHVSIDQSDPFHVYGGLQDNSSWVGDSQYPGGIGNSRWENMYGGDGFWMFEDPADPSYIYAEYQGGNIGRVNRTTHELRSIQPEANYNEKLRWNWNTPIALSPNEKGTIYIGSQFLFRSHDHGQSWDRISPDLSTNDPLMQKQEESGGVTVDNSAAEMHTTIYSISESPKAAGQIWVGTDDGNVQLTRDAGKSWSNVVHNVKGVPEHSWVSWVQSGNFDAGTAFAAFDRHTFGDMAPYIYETRDYGKTWNALVSPKDAKGVRGYVHVIKQDPAKPEILYAGTEFGLWISIDGGKRWAEFKGGDFPAVAVRDMAFQNRDASLALATHGRGIWIIDDLTPLRALDEKTLDSEAAFLATRPIQQRINAFGGWAEGDASFTGPNPPNGAEITYYQKGRHLFGKLKIDILDDKGSADRHDPSQRAPRHQPRDLVDARQAAARSVGGADRVQLDAGPARSARHVHGAHDQGQGSLRDEDRRRPRSSRDVLGGRSPRAVRRGDEGAHAVRRDERAGRPDQRGPRAGRCDRFETAGERSDAQAARRSLGQGRRDAQEDRGDEGGRRDHRRGAPARAHGHAVRRDHVVRRQAVRLPDRAHRCAEPRTRRRQAAVREAARRRPCEDQCEPAREEPARDRRARSIAECGGRHGRQARSRCGRAASAVGARLTEVNSG